MEEPSTPRAAYLNQRSHTTRKTRRRRLFRGPEMAIHTVASILDLLRGSRLLRAEEVCALEGLAARAHEPEELLEGARGQGWLTRYQIQELVAGRGEALLLGDYLVLAPIGEGGSARVFKGRHRLREALVALKVMRQHLLPDVALDR